MANRPKSRTGSMGRLSYQPAPDEGLIPKTLEFLRTELPAWRDDPRRPAGSSEKLLNSSLCDFLESSRARSMCPMVRFKHEAPQSQTHAVDIGVHGIDDIFIGAYGYTIYQPFLLIECKRLPAPSKDREREYVTGTYKKSGGATGGIQRFKLGLHGADVETAAIVGYVEEQTTRHWHATINGWIAELAIGTSADGCAWSQADKLEQLVCNDEQDIAIAVSAHRRADACLTPRIRVHHFWIVMTPRTR